jgi:hypothetical protein
LDLPGLGIAVLDAGIDWARRCTGVLELRNRSRALSIVRLGDLRLLSVVDDQMTSNGLWAAVPARVRERGVRLMDRPSKKEKQSQS